MPFVAFHGAEGLGLLIGHSDGVMFHVKHSFGFSRFCDYVINCFACSKKPLPGRGSTKPGPQGPDPLLSLNYRMWL